MKFIIVFLTFCLTFVHAQKKKQASSVYLSVYISNGRAIDTLTLVTWDSTLSLSKMIHNNPTTRVQKAANDKNSFVFKVDNINQPTHFELGIEQPGKMGMIRIFGRLYLDEQLMEPGDSVRIDIDSLADPVSSGAANLEFNHDVSNMRFSGKGAAKYEFNYTLGNKFTKWLIARRKPFQPPQKIHDSTFYSRMLEQMSASLQIYDSVLSFQLGYLKGYKNKMSDHLYQIFEADLIGSMEDVKCQGYEAFKISIRSENNLSPALKEVFQKKNSDIYLNRRSVFDNISIPSYAIGFSTKYLEYLTDDAHYVRSFSTQKDGYFYLKNKYNRWLGEKLLTNYLLKWHYSITDASALIQDAHSFVQTKFYKEYIGQMYDSEMVGSKAYNFSLPDANEKTTTLEDFRGKIVFMDLWYTGCGGCAAYYKNIVSKVESTFKNNPEIVFITINTDKEKDRWLNSIKSNMYTSPGLPNVVNLNTGGVGYESPVIKHYNVTAFPQPIVIDRNGNIYKTTGLWSTPEELITVIYEAIKK